MSDLKSVEKLQLEKLFGMPSGYVLDFSNRTFREFVYENVGIDIFDDKYDYASGSKANRLREFWKVENNEITGKLILGLLEYWEATNILNDREVKPAEKNLCSACKSIGERLVNATTVSAPDIVAPTSEQSFQVGLSFAGEDRAYVKQVAEKLQSLGVKVFYDEFEQSSLWGKDLYQHLNDVYKNKCKYCIVFVSKSYAEKVWTKHELKSAQARAFRENKEYILPVRFDNTELPGLNETVAYLDGASLTPDEIAQMAYEKL